jgi:outer membrane protein assembly factor BamA
LEGSAEYRFPIYSFVKGAFFTDFGNVWGLQERKKDGRYLRPGAQFQIDQFYNQIAVGSGAGIRFDFTFLILRLDVATKVYDPTAPDGQKWALRNFNEESNRIAFNLGIGYPF